MFNDYSFKNVTADGSIIQPYFSQTDCADVAVNSKNFGVTFISEQNYQFTLNQALLMREGDDCVIRVAFQFASTNNLIVLGQPAMKNMNITIDFDNQMIGFNNGVNLTLQVTDFTARVAILLSVFALIALGGFSINFSIERARAAQKEAEKFKNDK